MVEKHDVQCSLGPLVLTSSYKLLLALVFLHARLIAGSMSLRILTSSMRSLGFCNLYHHMESTISFKRTLAFSLPGMAKHVHSFVFVQYVHMGVNLTGRFLCIETRGDVSHTSTQKNGRSLANEKYEHKRDTGR